MEMTSELEDRLVKLDKDIRDILHLTGKHPIEGKIEREMREKSYDV